MSEIKIDSARCVVKVNGTPISLTPKERKLLTVLAKAGGRVKSRESLMSAVWEASDLTGDSRTIDQHISRLREKLGAAAVRLVTVAGEGYRLDAVEPANPLLCPVGLIRAVKRSATSTRAEILWKGSFPSVKKGARVVLA